MGSPPLPVELTDRIIDFCHDDKRTLSNCTLTHSSWLAASRFHLFDTITTVGVDSDTDRVNQLASVVNRTSSALPHGLSILPYIRTVKIDSLVEFDRPARLRCAAHLVDTIRQLCNREGLPAPSVHASLSMAFGRREALRQFSLVNDLVTQVRLSSISFSHPRYIWPFLSSFPRLQYLGLERVGFGDSPTSSFPAEDIFNGIPLSTIRMTTAYMGFIIASLIRVAGSLPHLEDFGIEYQDIRQAALPRLADAIQERVKCLKFSVECCPGVNRGGDPRPSASDISEWTIPLSHPKTDGLDVRQGFQNLLGGFGHSTLSSWATSGWSVPAAMADPTYRSSGYPGCCSNYLHRFGSWCLR